MQLFIVQKVNTTGIFENTRCDVFLFESRTEAFSKMQDLIKSACELIKQKYLYVEGRISEGSDFWQFDGGKGRIFRIDVSLKQPEDTCQCGPVEPEDIALLETAANTKGKKMSEKDYIVKYAYAVNLLDKRYSLFNIASRCGISVSTVSKVKKHLINYRKTHKYNEKGRISRASS